MDNPFWQGVKLAMMISPGAPSLNGGQGARANIPSPQTGSANRPQTPPPFGMSNQQAGITTSKVQKTPSLSKVTPASPTQPAT